MTIIKKVLNFYRKLLAENRGWFLISGLIFVGGVTTGVVISFSDPKTTGQILSNYASSIDFEVKDGFPLVFNLLERNATIVLIATLGGFFLGLVPIFITYINGLLLGIVVGFSANYQILNIVQVLSLLIPHGIFEYSASLLGVSFGLKIGLAWVLPKASGKRLDVFIQSFKDALYIVPLVLLLLTMAALVEGLITSKIACFLTGACQ